MDASARPKRAPPKHRLRWFQFSLRTLLILMVICGVACALVMKRVERKRREREIVAAMEKLGACVEYDYQLDANRNLKWPAVPPGPAWLRRLLGENFFCEVESVSLKCRKANDADIEPLEGLTELHVLDLQSTNITNAGLARIKGLVQLRGLSLIDTRITDAGLANLSGLAHLEVIFLEGTKITDAGLDSLLGLKHLEMIDILETEVSEKGEEKIRRALPGCLLRPLVVS